MLSFVVATVAALASAPVSAEPSNPAFLGVGMHDLGTTGPCIIDNITKNSGAHAAGLRADDIFVSLDGAAVPNCDALVRLIQAREPGDKVKLSVRRASLPMEIDATLYSRADVMRQRYVGQILPLATLLRVDDQTETDLSSRGKTTIVGWFDQGCSGCDQIFANVAQWTRAKSSRQSPIVAFAATAADTRRSLPETLTALKHEQRRFDVPLLVSDVETYRELAITDQKRISFMVIDCKGVVQYAVPLKPDADDTRAILDELYAAAEQAARRK